MSNNSGEPSQNVDDLFDEIVSLKTGSSVSSLATSKTTSATSSATVSTLRRQRSGVSSGSAQSQASKKQKLADERATKHALNEMNKIYKPGECMKYMNIEMHPTLLGAWYCADVQREAAAAGARLLTAHDQCDPALVTWSRTLPHTLADSGGQMTLGGGRSRCARALYVCAAGHAAEHVAARRLRHHIMEVRSLVDASLTLVVFGVKDYFKSTGRKTQNSSRKLMSEIDLEIALSDLLLLGDCDSAIVNTPNELALLIVQFTKALAEESYKKSKRSLDELADFYMRGDNRKCVPVDKDGNGLSRLWQQMIAVLPMSSLETSRALCAQYKSPLALFEALQSPDSVAELANLGVSRTAVPGAKARRLGPEFAKKLKILFTAENGDDLVD